MCGIAGLYNNTSLKKNAANQVKEMLGTIRHRGPDENGIYIGETVAIGSVRLSIIDLYSGQQPLSSIDGRFWIVFNGEIFNYIEIKTVLIRKGYSFRTDSDTEVLLNAYINYGTDCLSKLNGQFAFAIWDKSRKELFLARDRAGIRPLFYTFVQGSFAFSSEIKAFLTIPGFNPQIDLQALSQVFTYWTTISPKTIFQNIFELPPGHFLKISDNDFKITKFWTLEFPVSREAYFQGSIADASEQLTELLTDAVNIRLRADVQIAAYLSGGIDSSTTTLLIKSIAPKNLKTYSIGFEEAEFDETPFQEEVSSFLDTDHLSFRCTNEEIGLHFPSVVWHAEIPMLRTAPVPMYCLSKAVHDRNIKVVITGEGADEMLAGYDIFKETMIREFWARYPDSKSRPVLFNKLYPYLSQFHGKNNSMLKYFYGYKLNEIDHPFYSHLVRWKNTAKIQSYFSTEIVESIKDLDYGAAIAEILPKDFKHYDLLSKAQWLESFVFMTGYLLSSQGDRVAMANSVEGRYPFLDYRVMEFCSRLPGLYKLKGLNEKFLLKKMMYKRLPEKVLKRSKQAYRAPMASSFLSKSASYYVNELLSEKDIKNTGLFNYRLVEQLMLKAKSGALVTEMENMALSGIISTQLLYHQFIIGDGYRPQSSSIENCRMIYEDDTI